MVNRKRNYTLHFSLMAVLVTIAIGSVNYLGMEFRTRIDLTADQRFTLSEGTQRLFEKLTEPITVTYYVDAEPPAKRINLERDVRDKLEELTVSSAGKLQYRVERITNEEASTKRKDLEEKGISVTVDVITSGTDDRAEMRGIQGYFSSIEIAYGTAEPKAINGIVNLVDKADEAREHRVDTLEFDIAYTVLTMRNETRRPSFDKLLKTFDKPVRIAYYVTDPMPEQHSAMADYVDRALNEIAQVVPEKIDYERVPLGADARPNQPYAFDKNVMFQLQPFDGVREPVFDAEGRMTGFTQKLFYCAVIIQLAPEDTQFGAIWEFIAQQSVAEAKTVIENHIWERKRPRSRLGFILPPGQPSQQPGQPPRSGHSGVLGYIQSNLQYETSWVDLKTEKRVPRDLACLIVIEPNQLTEREMYEIDRYLGEGGSVVMLVQGWSASLDFSFNPNQNVRLTKEPTDPAFEEWAKHIGVEFGQDMLMRKNGKLQPFAYDRQQQHSLIPTPVRLAPVVEPEDLNAASVFTRGLPAMPLPMVVETKVDNDRIRELELEQTDLIRLRGDVYRYIPENPAMPEVPIKFNLNSIQEVQEDTKASPGKDIRAQKLDHEPLVATVIRGQFPSLWVDDKRQVPGWGGDPESEEATKVLNPGKGTLIVMSTAAFLNTDYLSGYPPNEVVQRNPQTGEVIFGPVIDRGLTFYRNVAEAFIYGDDLVSLRARTGVAPRITGTVDSSTKTMWFIVCVAGVPLLLLLFAGARAFINARDRQEYELALGLGEDK
jgi:hypothetical protein